MGHAITRRGFAGLLLTGGAGLLVAACGGGATPSSNTPQSAATSAPAGTSAPTGAATTASTTAAPTTATTSASATAAPTTAATSASATAAPTTAATSASATAAPTTAATSAGATPAQQAAAGKSGGTVSYLCRPDIVTAYGAQDAVKRFQDSHPGTTVALDQPPQGVDLLTKLRAAIASNSLVWDGYSVMVAPWDTAQWVEAQVVQPLDGLISASTEPDATKLLDGIIPTIKEATKYKGKIYSIPGNVGSIALQWYWEPLKAVGYTKQPATWDEAFDAATKILGMYGTKWIPFAQNGTPLCGYFALMFAALPPNQLFTTDGLLNIQAQGSLDALNWMQKMVKAGLMPPTDKNVNEDWDRKTVAMLMSYDVKGEGAQKTYGYDAADTGINIFPKAGEINSGTPFWMNSSVVLNKAKNPQGMADFFVWWFGPSNGPAQQTLVATAAKPCYSYTYEQYVKKDPNFAWEQTGIDLVAKSAPFPANTNFYIQSNAITPWQDKFLAPNSTLSANDMVKNAAKDIQDKISAQQG
jgi:hypothetical protein